MSHRVRQHIWENGILRTLDHFFEELHLAIDFANKQEGAHTKVYDHDGQLVHSITNNVVGSTYA
jgi:hypothetical protein